MLTPQEVAEHAFAKSAFGGYNMAMVDEFLDELTDDYTALYKENAALKAKMKVLVDKVEEYRATEDAMRKALLTAQTMATSMVSEAFSKRSGLTSTTLSWVVAWMFTTLLRRSSSRERELPRSANAPVSPRSRRSGKSSSNSSSSS